MTPVDDAEIAVQAARFADAAYHDRCGGDATPVVRQWQDWCKAHSRSMVMRATVFEGLKAQMRVEDQLIRFAVYLRVGRGLQPSTVRAYLGTLYAWHTRRFGEMLPGFEAVRLRAVLKGMRRLAPKPTEATRRGVRPQLLARALRECLETGVVGGAAEAAAIAAIMSVGFCGFLRVGEYATKSGRGYDDRRLPVWMDVTFWTDGASGRQAATLMIEPRKKPGSLGWGKTAPVTLRDGSLLTPASDLKRLHALRRPLPTDPLFVLDGRPVTDRQVTQILRWLMQRVGERPASFSSHSLRIGAATAAMAAGVAPDVIKKLGRWDSDVALVYQRMSREAAMRIGAAVASTAFEDFEAEQLGSSLW